jgi:sialic acid synthase SpsE
LNQCKFIAEVSSNHHNDLKRCLEFVDTAADIGCWAVKFQAFSIDDLFAPEALLAKPELNKRREWELNLEYIPSIADHCRNRGIKFGVTPFSLGVIPFLVDYVDFFKVASYELLWIDLIKLVASTNKPLQISTGMSTPEEILSAIAVTGDNRPLMFHCTSSYPTPEREANLSAIDTIRTMTGCEVGWSDHTMSPNVVVRSVVHWNASAVEFHLDLDGQGEEYSSGHCWLPQQIKEVIQFCNDVATIDGNGGKFPVPSEIYDRNWRADPSDGLRPLKTTRRNL